MLTPSASQLRVCYQHKHIWPSERGPLFLPQEWGIDIAVALMGCFPSYTLVGWSLYLCPADCFQEILVEQLGTSHSNKLGFLQHIK